METADLQTIPEGPPGTPGNLDNQQTIALNELRKRLQDDGYKNRLDDPSLLRFLRARDFNVEKAYKMFVDCEKWREEFHVDDLIKNFDYKEKPLISQYYPQYYHKTDKDGRPVYIEQLGKIDLHKMLEITTMERMLQALVVEYEKFALYRLPACSRKKGKLIETSCTIIDIKRVSITSISQVYEYLKRTSHIGQNYYPERMGKLYIINAPWGFSTVWKFISKFLDPATVQKISILGSNYEKALLDQIPPENLPTRFGGKSLTGDVPVELTDEGPWNDEEYRAIITRKT